MTDKFSVDENVIDSVNVFLEGQNNMNEQLNDLIQVISEKDDTEQSEKQLLDESIDNLVTFLQEKEALNDIDKDRLEDLLTVDDLTEEEQAELDLLIEKENAFDDLETAYLTFQTENQEEGFNYLESINESMVLMNDNLETIIVQNEVSNNADHIVSIYGMIVFPALIIFVFFLKILSRYF